MATHSSVLPWRILGTAEPGGLPSIWGRTESDTTERLSSSSSSSLHFQGSLVPISLWPVLGIVAAHVLGTVWPSCS